jgi:uncharacterized protein (TIGR02147 family)
MKHFSDTLKLAFEAKQTRNPSYSMSALARDLDLSKSYVSRVFSGAKIPSAKFLARIVDLLRLSEAQKKEIYISICFESLPTSQCQKYFVEATAGINRALEFSSFYLLEDESLAMLEKWQAMAILQLMATQNFKPDVEWIATHLGTTKEEVLEAVALLFHHELISEENGKWIKANRRIALTSNIPNAIFTNYQVQMIRRQLQEIENNQAETDRRHLTGLTVATTPEKIEQAKKIIDNAIKESFEILKDEQATEVYQLNIGLVPLSKAASS